jgi:hypothetical protein
MSELSAETLRAKKAWGVIFQTLKAGSCQPRLLYTAKLSFKIEYELWGWWSGSSVKSTCQHA